MISLEQVNQLEIRVKKAVGVIKALSAENAALKLQVSQLEENLDELKQEASSRKADEQRLEMSLQGVLDVLDDMDEIEKDGVEGPFGATTGNADDISDDQASVSSDFSESVDKDEEAQILSEPEDEIFDEVASSGGESQSMPDEAAAAADESEADQPETDDTPEEINLDESSDESFDDDRRDGRVQSEFDIF